MKPIISVPASTFKSDADALAADGWLVLRHPSDMPALVVLAPQPVTPSVDPDVDVPPPAVLAAIQTISPTRDATYEANWRHWEKHKAHAAAHPDAFAQEIIDGVGV